MSTTDSPRRREFLQGGAAVLAASCLGLAASGREDRPSQAWNADRRRADRLSVAPPAVQLVRTTTR